MKRYIHPCRLLAVFLIVGLVIAPLSAGTNTAAAASMTSKIGEMSGEAASMSADMPCCPDKSAPMDCDQCPLMAICMVKTFQSPSSAGFVEILPVTVQLLFPHSDPEADSLGYPPPPRPPRSLVRSA